MPQCQHVKNDGSRCGAHALRSAANCFFHAAEMEIQRDEACRSGGQAGAPKVLADAPNVPVTSSSEVCALLGQTLNQVRRGELDPKLSNSIGFLAGVLLKALAQARIEADLRILIAALTEHPRPRSSDELTDVSHLEG